MTRIILFTGKGGVGKTTIAAATALKCSKLGYKTIVISADPAHSLSDSFQQNIKPYPTKIRENLYAMEINVEYEIEKNWDSIIKYLKTLFISKGLDDVIAEELAILPGFDELASLFHVLSYSNRFDVIILDCAPTGETLRLLSLPEVMSWYMNKFFGIERKLLKVVKPIAKPIIDAPLPSDDVLDAVKDLYVRITKLKDVLMSRDTTVRLVMNPEKMVIKESERAFTYLNLFGYIVDCIIVNKVFPEDIGGYLSKWIEIQRKYITEIQERFPVPIFKVKFRETEIIGNMLDDLSEELYNGRNPTEVFCERKPMEIKKEGEETIISIKLPFVSKEDLKVLKKGDELIVITNGWKRIILLPRSLATKEPIGAKFINDELKIRMR